MALPASDSFTGSANAALSASWTTTTGLAAPMLNALGTGARTNAVTSDSGAWWNADAFADDQYAEIVVQACITDTNRCVGAAVRVAADANTFYAAICRGPTGANATAAIRKAVGGSTATLASGTRTINVGDTLRCEVTGANPATIKLLVNGTQQLSTTDSDIDGGGAAGIFVFVDIGATSDAVIDSWTGGNLTTSTPITVNDLTVDNLAGGEIV